GVLPPQQHLAAHALLAGGRRGERHDGLEDEAEPPLLEPGEQRRELTELDVPPELLGIPFAIDLDAVAPLVLGGVASRVGAGEQRGGVRCLRRDGDDADAGAELEDAALPGEAEVAHGATDLLRDLLRALERAPLEQEAELVAAAPRQQIARPALPAQETGGLH